MKMTQKQFELLQLRPALYNGTIITMRVAFDDKSFYRVDAKIAASLDMPPGDTASIFGEAVDFSRDGHKYCYEKFCMSGDVLTSFIEQFGYEHITTDIYFKVKFKYVYSESDGYFENDGEQLVFEVLEINSQNQNPSDSSDGTPSWLNDYFVDGMK